MQAGIHYPGVSVAFFCHDGTGEFVFHKRSLNTRSHHGMWDNGGGGVEIGETIEQALHRELAEEYGCAGTIDERLYPNTLLDRHGGEIHHWIVFPFIMRVHRTDVTIGEPHKMDALDWYRLDQLPSPLHPGVAQDLAMYADIFKKYS